MGMGTIDQAVELPPLSTVAARMRRSVPWLALAVTLTTVTVLVGWATGSAALKSLVPGTITMKVNTAAALGLLAAGLACLNRPSRAAGGLLAGCLAGTAAVAVATLAEYAFGLDLGIDEL